MTLIKFAGKMWYDTACIAVGSAIMWRNELQDLYLRGWFDPQATFDTTSIQDMHHD